jgi:F-type H+-transporting ATPase subunit a
VKRPGELAAALFTLALIAPSAAMAKGEFHPEDEFELHDWLPIHIGPLNLSINKAVAYLLLGALLTIVLGIVTMRVRFKPNPDRRETIGESIYDIAQTQVAEQGLPTKAIGRWFPYVASLMLFIWVVNLLGFIPLPLSDEKFHVGGVALPTWGIYAATSSLSVTLTLALLTFVFTHYEGIRWNGPVRYFKSWIPEVPKALLPLIIPLEILGQFMRLISLSVRLFANMLAGHMLILTFIGLIFVLESVVLAVVAVPAATAFYLFEVVIVVSIQAFIFAALSAIYIGSAIEPEH